MDDKTLQRITANAVRIALQQDRVRQVLQHVGQPQDLDQYDVHQPRQHHQDAAAAVENGGLHQAICP